MIQKSHILCLVFLIFSSSYSQELTVSQIEKLLDKNSRIVETNPNLAIKTYSDLYNKSQAIDYKRGMAFSQVKIASAYFFLDKTDKVIQYASDAEKIALSEKEYYLLVESMRFRALAYGSINSYDETYKILKAAIAFSDKIADKNKRYMSKGNLYISLANSYYSNIKYPIDSAIVYNRKCIATYKKLTPELFRNKYLAAGYTNLGSNYLSVEEMDSAEYYLKKGLALPKLNDDKHGEIYAYRDLADIYSSKKQYNLSIDSYLKAIGMAKEYKNNLVLQHLYFDLSKVYTKVNNNEKSSEYLALYKKLSDSLSYLERSRVGKTLDAGLKAKEQESK